MPLLVLLPMILKYWWVGALVGLGAAAAIAWGVYQHRGDELAKAKQQVAAAQAQTTVSQGQVQAQTQASQIADDGVRKQDVTVHIQQENSRAILSAPGASQGVDPVLYANLTGGMCRYASTLGDGRCPGLPGADPAIVPPAGQVSGDPGANSR